MTHLLLDLDQIEPLELGSDEAQALVSESRIAIACSKALCSLVPFLDRKETSLSTIRTKLQNERRNMIR